MKIKILYVIALLFLSYGCENSENDFPDFDEQNVYFPIQYPIRTISLQEDSYTDNSIDLEKSFNIGVAIGGLRANDKDRIVNVALAPELVQNAFVGANPVLLMPSNYYTLSTTEVVIPKGSFSGLIRVQLTDAFFNDPLAITNNYVIALVITNSNSTGILTGSAIEINGVPIADPDRRVNADWQTGKTPKDFTMFAVKFINKYHGKYLHKGQDDTLDGPSGNVVTSEVYNTQFIERNILTDLFTKGLTLSNMNRLGRNTGGSNQMDLDFTNEQAVNIITSVGGYDVSGVGRLVSRDSPDAESWGGEPRKTLFLDYEYEAAGVFHRVKDTLVFRNDELKFEEFSVSIMEP